ncbi:hypothetical protein LIER_42932 [Lithospermum erythrorhizon]|uniref:SPX domain-containing protein n=1 Tax=Lithospermum erythrorhizon TaxID=34254 RepID=A0AAV3P7P2_LITER
MKFGKRLKQQTQETLPGWRDKFLSYKELKKLVKLITSAAPKVVPHRSSSLEYYGKAEAEFVYLLNNEIEKFNAFFIEQEEDFVIRHKGMSKYHLRRYNLQYIYTIMLAQDIYSAIRIRQIATPISERMVSHP